MSAISRAAFVLAAFPVAFTQPAAKPKSLEFVPDERDESCLPGQACSANTRVPTERGLCVTGGWCWDACNENHAPSDYSQDPALKAGFGLMVKQMRTGQRYGSCPGGLLQAASCNAGERCLPFQSSTWGRGMCVAVPGQGNQCLDMCDTKIPISTFHDMPGKPSGTVNIVSQVRAGRDPAGRTFCPGASVWLWLWIPLTLCICVACCAASWYLYQNVYRRGISNKNRRNKGGYPEPDQPFVEDGAPYADYGEMPGQYQAEEMMAPPQTQDYMEPMPVIEPAAPVLEPEIMVVEPLTTGGLFGAPNLMGGLAPATTAYGPATTSMSVPYGGMYAGAPITTAVPQTTSTYTQGYGAPMTTGYAGSAYGGSTVVSQAPQYGAYGAYNTVYPTGSMRIG